LQDLRLSTREPVLGMYASFSKCSISAVILVSGLCSIGTQCGNDVEAPAKPVLPRYRFADPSWSPRNDYLAFNYNVDPYGTLDTVGLYLFNLHDSTMFRHTAGNPRAPQDPDFSPDGRWITCSWGDQIWKMTVGGDSLTQLTFEGRNFFPAWCPDGGRIAYWQSAPDNGIFLMDSNGESARKVTNGIYPTWLDSEHVVFVRSDLMMSDTFGASEVTILERPSSWIEINNPSACSSLHKICFGAPREQHPNPDLWVVDFDGSNLVQLTSEGGDQPAWAPDGSRLVYTNTQFGEIWTMKPDGSDRARLIPR
jgi:Tol biopolymer transport system component